MNELLGLVEFLLARFDRKELLALIFLIQSTFCLLLLAKVSLVAVKFCSLEESEIDIVVEYDNLAKFSVVQVSSFKFPSH